MDFNKLLQALQIIAKHLDEDNTESIGADSDQLYLPGPHPKKMGYEDRKALQALGFTWDEFYDCWHAFV